MKAQQFVAFLEDCGFNFFTGVPCSYLGPLVSALGGSSRSRHVPAVREDVAVGLAAGAYMAGSLPVIYMQNSGLGYSLEAFASLHLIYQIPALVILSYRGPEDPNMEEHLIMGQHTEELLSTFGLAYSIVHGSVTEAQVRALRRSLIDSMQPNFLLITKGFFE